MITVKDTPKSMEVYELDRQYLAPTSHLSYYPLAIKKVKGATITDEDDNEFIDFLSSASSLNMGGGNTAVLEAMHEQIDNVSQYAFPYTYNKKTAEYAKRLCSVYPGGRKDVKIVFGNCGSDANDAAVKFARAYTGRQKIIVFQNAYHGNTYGASSMTTVTDRMRNGMGPFLPEIYVFPFFGTDQDDATVEANAIKQIEEAAAMYMPANEVAAVIIEPVQGDGGILPAHPIFMKKLYDWCQTNGVLFISEEVQQAFWRTGKFFAIEHYGIEPDGIIMGKSIGAGTPVGAFMARAEIMDCLPAPAHLFTLSGNPLGAAAGSAAFDFYNTDEFQSHLTSSIDLLVKLAEDLKQKHPDVVDFHRNLGMSMGIGLKSVNGESAEDVTYKVLYRAYQRGLIVISLCGTILRIQPPLVITAEELTRGFEIISESIEDLLAGDIGDEVFEFRAGW